MWSFGQLIVKTKVIKRQAKNLSIKIKKEHTSFKWKIRESLLIAYFSFQKSNRWKSLKQTTLAINSQIKKLNEQKRHSDLGFDFSKIIGSTDF